MESLESTVPRLLVEPADDKWVRLVGGQEPVIEARDSYHGAGRAGASLRRIPMSPKKVSHFVALLRRKHVDDALAQCQLHPKKAAQICYKASTTTPCDISAVFVQAIFRADCLCLFCLTCITTVRHSFVPRDILRGSARGLRACVEGILPLNRKGISLPALQLFCARQILLVGFAGVLSLQPAGKQMFSYGILY